LEGQPLGEGRLLNIGYQLQKNGLFQPQRANI
jgi:hypothetical protein